MSFFGNLTANYPITNIFGRGRNGSRGIPGFPTSPSSSFKRAAGLNLDQPPDYGTPPSYNDPNVLSAEDEERRAQQRGRASTILTGPSGVGKTGGGMASRALYGVMGRGR